MLYPSGTVTFLFTDIEGSTKLAQENDVTYLASLGKHHKILYDVVDRNNGFVFKIVGDAFCCAFAESHDAMRAAVESQAKLCAEDWGDSVIRVRMGIHSGNAEWNGKDYMGYMTLARTNRVMSSAYGNQILISNDVRNKLAEANLAEVSFRDLGERRLKDLIQPMRLFQIVSPDIPSEFPPLKTLDARPNNLPVQLTSFIGREKELSEIKKLLSSTRLLTLLGSGGTGKTRLALQAGADMIDEFANGVWIAELAEISDPSKLAQTVLRALGTEEKPAMSMYETLAEFLKDKQILLILDNCEHVIDECSHLAEVLQSKCQKLKILATSREALKCSGEQTYNIPSLAHPQRAEKMSPEKLSQYEAVRLFIERALLVNPGFRVTNENAPSLAEVCARLDGIPLAIELAAARMKALSVEKIHARLDDRFALLTAGRRTALPRQQTLKALIDWSYDLLPDEEKTLWKRLSVFSGGFSLEAAEEICSDDDLDKYIILDCVSNLAEKSILIYDDSTERYKMLETIHQYGTDLLKNKDEHDALHKKHLSYFMNVAVQQSKRSKGTDQSQAFALIESDHGNIQSALSYALASGDFLGAAEMATSVSYFWIIRGYLFVGNSWFEEILKHEEHIPKKLLYVLLDKAGGLKLHQSAYDECEKLYKRSFSIKEELGEKLEMSKSLNNLGSIAARKGDYENAGKMFEQYLSIMRDLDMRANLPNALNNLSLLELYTGAYDKARLSIEESLKLCEEFSDNNEKYFANRNAGKLAFELGDYDKSAEYHEKALAISREYSYKSGIAVTLAELSQVLIELGDHKRAKLQLEESLLIAKESDETICIAMSLVGLGELAEAELEDKSASEYFGEALKLYREVGDLSGVVITLKNLGRVKFKLNEADEAKTALIECLRLNLKMGQKQEAPEVMILIANILENEGRELESIQMLISAKEFLSDSKDTWVKKLLNRIGAKLSDLREKLGEEKYSDNTKKSFEPIEKFLERLY
jgi:predicted ATPase/class 3 adenylate cyclase/Tfp pilus assembly protein PilF